MVWETRIRYLSWLCFLLMFVPLVIVVYSAAIETEEPPVAAIAALIFFSMLFAIFQFGSFVIGGAEKETIRKKGIAATATIISVSDTGTMINNQPLLRIELDVQPPYNERFTATVEYVVPYSALPRVQPGNVLKVYYVEESKEVALADL